jgi:hypothetical protein
MTVQINREGRALFAALGAAMIVVGGLVAAINSAAPFDHGSWLAAYLLLVAGVSQIALGLGHLLLPVRPPSARLLRVQLACWNAGNLVVAGGVLAGTAAVVIAGSAVLLVALGGFAAGAGWASSAARWRLAAYHAFGLMLAVSIFVGAALAGSNPGA